MAGAQEGAMDSLSNPEFQTSKQKYNLFIALIEKAKKFSNVLTFWEMHNLASLLPDWMHHLSTQEIPELLEAFSQGRFISFLQKGYKEAFGEVCRQAYLHGRLYHVLEDVAIDKESAEVIKSEVEAEVLHSNKKCRFAKLRGHVSELAVQVDREPHAKNTKVVDAIVADAVVEAACKKMSHPLTDLQNHEDIRQLAKQAIVDTLGHQIGEKRLTLLIPQPKGHGAVNFIYDMAAFILKNKRNDS